MKKHDKITNLPTPQNYKWRVKRAAYLKFKNIFKSFSENYYWQPYKIPTQPNLVKIGNNVNVATQVLFREYDIIHRMLNNKNRTTSFREKMRGLSRLAIMSLLGQITLFFMVSRLGAM